MLSEGKWKIILLWTKRIYIKNAFMLTTAQVPCLGLQQILHHCWKLSEPVHCTYGELQVLFPHTPWDPKQTETYNLMALQNVYQIHLCNIDTDNFKEQIRSLLTLNAWSPHFSNALSPWFVMWFSNKVRSCPSPSGILATKLYIRPRSVNHKNSTQDRLSYSTRVETGKITKLNAVNTFNSSTFSSPCKFINIP